MGGRGRHRLYVRGSVFTDSCPVARRASGLCRSKLKPRQHNTPPVVIMKHGEENHVFFFCDVSIDFHGIFVRALQPGIVQWYAKVAQLRESYVFTAISGKSTIKKTTQAEETVGVHDLFSSPT